MQQPPPTHSLDRRRFLALLSATGAACAEPFSALAHPLFAAANSAPHPYSAGAVPNDYSTLLPGEQQALATPPTVLAFTAYTVQAGPGTPVTLAIGQSLHGWQLLALPEINGVRTAVFEKHVTHRGAIAYVTQRAGTIALIPKGIGQLSSISPRRFLEPARLQRDQIPGPPNQADPAAAYILGSTDDPAYENVAALGPEYIGWSLVANEEAGPLRSLFLEPDGTSRQPQRNPQNDWAPDLEGALFNPQNFLPFDDPGRYRYEPGWSKRTLLGGYLPVADTGVWNETHHAGYEVLVLLPPGTDATPIARVRVSKLPPTAADLNREQGNGAHDEPATHEAEFTDHYWNTDANGFFSALAGIWNHWHDFHENAMPVQIPDPWLLDAARAGITLARCSYRGLEPTYQVGEGAYTKIPERSHALFPVAAYEFIWAQQLWNHTQASNPYFNHYLDHYILPDGNFLYNVQDQVEAPLNVGLFLWNNARAYSYSGDLAIFEQRLPTLERMLAYVLARYQYSLEHYPPSDRRYGLIWGSPEADLGDPANDYPQSHPFYFQNATVLWRGLYEHALALQSMAQSQHQVLGAHYGELAVQMRAHIARSLQATIAAGDPAMRRAGITPFETNDTAHPPRELSSYENHRFMEDFFLADWGDPALDEGHLRHRALSGLSILGLNTDGPNARVSNFTAHGTLAVRIRQDDYRPFLLALYGLACFCADSGNRYSPEDAYVPGSYPGEQSPYGWSAVINSTLQPTMGLRWLLCYEESSRPTDAVSANESAVPSVVHLQKAAPKHWFRQGERIAVERCPTRFGPITWSTEALSDRSWMVRLTVSPNFAADLHLHIHPPAGTPLRTASAGTVQGQTVILSRPLLAAMPALELTIAS